MDKKEKTEAIIGFGFVRDTVALVLCHILNETHEDGCRLRLCCAAGRGKQIIADTIKQFLCNSPLHGRHCIGAHLAAVRKAAQVCRLAYVSMGCSGNIPHSGKK